MERIIHEHEPREGVLVWGGPEHGRVVPYDRKTMARGVVLFPVERRLAYMAPDVNPMAQAFGTVAYDVDRWAVPWDDGTAEMWFVLVYKENKARLLDNFTGTAKTVMWMADPTRWTDA